MANVFGTLSLSKWLTTLHSTLLTEILQFFSLTSKLYLKVPNEYNPLSLSQQDLLVVSSQQLKLPCFICCLQAQFEFALTAVAEEVNAILQALAK